MSEVRGFSPDWLALREPADMAARSREVTAAVAHVLAQRTGARQPLRVLDLGTGTGSNARHLMEQLGDDQAWVMVDHDLALLQHLRESMAGWGAARGCRVEDEGATLRLARGHAAWRLTARQRDLADAQGLYGEDDVALVTASALLDLVSGDWMRALVDRCWARRTSMLFALNYDGRFTCRPPEAADEVVRALVNRHQRTDKGFGPALGPDAAVATAAHLASRGYVVVRGASDWRLGAESHELQRQLVEGWARAALEMEPGERTRIDAWRARRQQHIEAGSSSMVVGHEDVGGWLPEA